jgi:hypothetical protein
MMYWILLTQGSRELGLLERLVAQSAEPSRFDSEAWTSCDPELVRLARCILTGQYGTVLRSDAAEALLAQGSSSPGEQVHVADVLAFRVLSYLGAGGEWRLVFGAQIDKSLPDTCAVSGQAQAHNRAP